MNDEYQNGLLSWTDPEYERLVEIPRNEYDDFLRVEKPYAVLRFPPDAEHYPAGLPKGLMVENRFRRRYLYEVLEETGNFRFFCRLSRPMVLGGTIQ